MTKQPRVTLQFTGWTLGTKLAPPLKLYPFLFTPAQP